LNPNGGGLLLVEDSFVGGDAAVDDYGADISVATAVPVTRVLIVLPTARMTNMVKSSLRNSCHLTPAICRQTQMAMENFLKNWAGPKHWELRKVIRKRGSSNFG
jgi:hypothetical protein